MLNQIKKLIVSLLLLNACYSSIAQKFPGGVTPLEDRIWVIKKIPVEGSLAEQMTSNQLKAATPISINGITFKTIWLFFESDKLVTMVLNIPNKSDQNKIISILSKKYKKSECYALDDVACFKNGNIKIRVTADLGLVYHYEKDEEF